MTAAGLGPWPLRIALALSGSLASSVQLALLLVRHYPAQAGLERLYAAVFLALAFFVTVLLWALLAPHSKAVGWRAAAWLLLFSPALLWGGDS